MGRATPLDMRCKSLPCEHSLACIVWTRYAHTVYNGVGVGADVIACFLKRAEAGAVVCPVIDYLYLLSLDVRCCRIRSLLAKIRY